MLNGLFLNACILITFLSIGTQFGKENIAIKEFSLYYKLIFGGCAGLLGILLMLNSFQVTPDIIIDFRYISILLAALFGGMVPSLLAAFIIGIFRFFFWGVSSASFIALIAAIVIGFGFGAITFFKIERIRKMIYALLFMMLVVIASFTIAVKETGILIKTLLVFCVSYFLVAYFILKYAEHMIETITNNQKLKQEATKDYLTGINNVREFDRNLNSITQMTIRKEEELSLLFVDIDFFKKVNDTYGHNAGDRVLKSLAQILLETCRVYDIVSRNGGEEFSIILLDCSAGKAAQIAERVRKKVENYRFELSDRSKIRITVSVGISSYPENTKQINDLPENADKALYQAKRTGRNKVILYDENK